MSEHLTADRSGTGADECELVSVVVEYDERPDQCTIYPGDSEGITRMSSWISADIDCFVDCRAMR
ncbi:DUF7511 domain-containing protein [Halorientalis salina]|uniref:DUF7511 domain-containing protein n=1 Tax=Halorientalis salina TaxID=2932266 RepID=UPI0010AC4FCC|nr:hypothetical protein [Halorientalis salina]